MTTVELNVLNILDDVVWFGGPDNVQPTVRRVAEHAQAMLDADLTYPIIMTKSGEVLDGAHRIAKAHLQGLTHVAAIVIEDGRPPMGSSKDSSSHYAAPNFAPAAIAAETYHS